MGLYFTRALLEHNKDVYPAYEEAFLNKRDHSFKFLLDEKVSIDVRQKNTGDSLLHLKLPLDYIKLIVESGADVNATNNQGISALAMQCSFDQLDNMAYLINMGAHVHKSVYELSPLYFAKTMEAVRLLVHHDVTRHTSSDEGLLKISNAVRGQPAVAIKANMHKDSCDALHKVLWSGIRGKTYPNKTFNTLRQLLANGLDINAMDSTGETPLGVVLHQVFYYFQVTNLTCILKVHVSKSFIFHSFFEYGAHIITWIQDQMDSIHGLSKRAPLQIDLGIVNEVNSAPISLNSDFFDKICGIAHVLE